MQNETISVVDESFFVKLNQTIEEANKKQTLEIKNEIEKLRDSIQEEAKKRSELEQQHQLLKEKYIQLEKSTRKNNIIIFGLDNNKTENVADYVINMLKTYLLINLDCRDINDVFYLGKQTKPSGKPIIVKLVSYLKKKEILKNCFKLKDVNKNRVNKIIISEELSPDEIKTQKVLRKHLNEAKSRKIHAYIKGEKIYINGDAYTVEDLEQQIINVNEESEEEEVFNFQGGSSSAPSTPTTINKKKEVTEKDNLSETAENDNKLENYMKKHKSVPSASTVQTRTSSRKQEDKNKKTGTPNEYRNNFTRNRNKEEEIQKPK